MHRMRILGWGALLIGLLFVLMPALAAAASAAETDVSPIALRFPKTKQNESPMAVNPRDSMNAISGANDEILEPDCTTTSSGSSSCPFAPGVDTSGVYSTKDSGKTWKRQVLHWFDQTNGAITSDGDPAVAFGPKPDVQGIFSWSNGVRAYFASLAGSPAFGPSQEILAVSFSDDGGDSWSAPVVATTRTNPVNFNDKEAIWVDANEDSPFFGTVYVSWTLFTGNPFGIFGIAPVFSPEPIMVARSTDGGLSYLPPVKLTRSVNNGIVGGRQGSTIRTGPDGTVYVIWDGALSMRSAILGAISRDGGASFTRPFLVSFKSDIPSPFPGASFRDNSFPSADVSAKEGKVFVVWGDYKFPASPTGMGHGVVKMAVSSNHGLTWSTSTIADVSGRSAFYPAVAATPDGSKVFVGFNAIDDKPFGTKPGAGVVAYDSYYVLSADGGATFGAPVKISAAPSDPDGSSTNALGAQFLGDYNGAAASDSAAWFSWTDSRNAKPCAAVDAFRAGTAAKPNIYDACDPAFGNTDIFVAMVAL